MFNLFGKKPEHPIATAFSGTTIGQKQSILNLLLLVGGCDSEDGPNPAEMKLLNSYVDIFNTRSDQAMARFQNNGLKGIVDDLNQLGEGQKDMLITMIHGMICVDGRPNEDELNFASNFCNSIGIDDEKYIEVVTKVNALGKHFL